MFLTNNTLVSDPVLIKTDIDLQNIKSNYITDTLDNHTERLTRINNTFIKLSGIDVDNHLMFLHTKSNLKMVYDYIKQHGDQDNHIIAPMISYYRVEETSYHFSLILVVGYFENGKFIKYQLLNDMFNVIKQFDNIVWLFQK